MESCMVMPTSMSAHHLMENVSYSLMHSQTSSGFCLSLRSKKVTTLPKEKSVRYPTQIYAHITALSPSWTAHDEAGMYSWAEYANEGLSASLSLVTVRLAWAFRDSLNSLMPS